MLSLKSIIAVALVGLMGVASLPATSALAAGHKGGAKHSMKSGHKHKHKHHHHKKS
jgi:ABC-type Zn2+ transport system substrate-binding protein/surface adhesin